jgi:hypothetical protein
VSALIWSLLAVAVIAGGAWFIRQVAPYYQDEQPLTGRHHEVDPAVGEPQSSEGGAPWER